MREAIAAVMAAEDMDVDPDEVIVTTGGQQAIDLVTKTLIDPGDVVIAEAPTYPGAVPTFCAYEAEVDPDRDGRRRHEHRRARETLAQLDAAGGARSSSTRSPTSRTPPG